MQKENKKWPLQVLIFAVVFAIAFFGTKYFFSGNPIDKALKKEMSVINKTCPKMLDAETRLDSVTTSKGKIVNYYFTLVHVAKETPGIDLTAAKNYVMKNTQDNLNNMPQMKTFRDNEVTMKYFYKDKDQKSLFDFSIKAQQKDKLAKETK